MTAKISTTIRESRVGLDALERILMPRSPVEASVSAEKSVAVTISLLGTSLIRASSGRAYARAGWSIIAVFIAEIFSLLPLISLTSDNGFTIPSLAHYIAPFVSAMLPMSIISPDASSKLVFASLEYLSYLIFAVVLLLVLDNLMGKSTTFGQSDKSSILWVVAAVVAACTIDILFDLYDYAAGHIQVWDFFRPGCGSYLISADSTRSVVIFLFSIFLLVVIGPLCEEILYRGILGSYLPPAFGALGSAVVSSSLFALAHFGKVNHFVDFADYFLMGLLFFSARIRFGGIGVPLAAHMAVNSFFTFNALLRC